VACQLWLAAVATGAAALAGLVGDRAAADDDDGGAGGARAAAPRFGSRDSGNATARRRRWTNHERTKIIGHGQSK
jgi:hypothetical protein